MKRLVALLGAALCLLAGPALAAGQTVVCLTTGTSWTVPRDWNSAQNTVELIGGAPGFSSGGGAYSKSANYSLAPGSSVTIQVGPAADTCFVSCATQLAKASSGSGAGGSAAASIGTVKYSGGSGGSATAGSGAGGGAAGPNGAGQNSSGNFGGKGDAGFGGAGGDDTGTDGSVGAEWTCDSGTITGPAGSGGGGGWDNVSVGGHGGAYGGGGATTGHGGTSSTRGLIVITYTARRSVSSGAF